MTAMQTLDLDAARREEEAPDGIIVTFKGEEFVVPAELPLDVFDPFFTDEFDIGGLLRAVLDSDDDRSGVEVAIELLIDRPKLPVQTWRVIQESLAALFGEEGWATFRSLRPSVQDTVRLVKGLFRMYGTTLGEAFASAESSVNGGPTPKQTSPSTTESTPDVSGASEEPSEGSSE